MGNYIFYHCATINDYYERFINTFSKIEESGLINDVEKIFITINGQSSCDFAINKKIDTWQKNQTHPNESITINRIRHFCLENKDCNILYLHGKGVTKPKNQNVNCWIEIMEHFLITKYKTCLNDLKSFDCVGSLFKNDGNPHFSGNFWWSRSDYISTLPDCPDEYFAPEMWLLKNNKLNVKSYFNSSVDFYSQSIEKDLYY